MNKRTAVQGAFAMMIIALCGCASVPVKGLSKPEVSLSSVECTGLGFNSQTFILSFHVHNPNAFDLPINSVSYGLQLQGERFATGETQGKFTVPANGSKAFVISVDLNLLSTSPQLLATVRDGVRNEVSYELKGRFGVDLPVVDVIKYRHAGTVRLQGSTTSFLSK